MRVPLSWLEEFVDTGGLSAEEIAERLSLQSAEAEVHRFGVELERVLYGRVLEIKSHPKDGRLSVVRVQISDGSDTVVVTADSGLREGEGVIVALAGARVGERRIERKEIGGVVSEGVLLTPEDLGVDEDEDGVLKLEGDLRPGTPAGELLGFGERIVELDITPNRGDLLSVRGLARDLSAIFGLERKSREAPPLQAKGELSIEVEDEDCSRYRGVVIAGVRVGRSPLWMRVRLWQAGIRTINNVVDVTNYILLQEGQPLHAFDLSRLSGGIVVRSARRGERILTLDSVERELDPEVLVIADREKPVAVAGVIGGLESAVTRGTEDLLLESAHFNPGRVRRGAKLLGIQTESSYRFERNTDVERVDRAQDAAVELILRIAGGEVRAVRDVYPRRYTPKRIFLSAGKYRRYAGEPFSTEEAQRILSSLEIPCSPRECGIEAFVPAHRSFDISRDVDLIEEIMRIRGYRMYPADRPSVPVEANLWRDELLEVRKYLRDRGLSEVVNISYEDAELYDLLGMERPSVEILNPLIPSQRFLRSSLIPSLLRSALHNENHYSYDIGVFEVGRVFLEESEEERVAVLLKGLRSVYPPREWEPADLTALFQGLGEIHLCRVDFGESSLPFLHPHVQSTVLVDSEEVGFIGRLHPEVSAELGFQRSVLIGELKLSPLLKRRIPRYRRLSKYPPAIRDLALSVDKSLPVSKLLNEIKSHLGEKAEEVMVFDVYAGEKVGEGKKSVGVRVVLRSYEGSLLGEEVNAIVDDLVRRLRELLGVEIR